MNRRVVDGDGRTEKNKVVCGWCDTLAPLFASLRTHARRWRAASYGKQRRACAPLRRIAIGM